MKIPEEWDQIISWPEPDQEPDPYFDGLSIDEIRETLIDIERWDRHMQEMWYQENEGLW